MNPELKKTLRLVFLRVLAALREIISFGCDGAALFPLRALRIIANGYVIIPITAS
jgi:hypothetical protein